MNVNKLKQVLNYFIIGGIFYIMLYQIELLRNICKKICLYILDVVVDSGCKLQGILNVQSVKMLYFQVEGIVRFIIIISGVLLFIIFIAQLAYDYWLKQQEGVTRFENSLHRYLNNTESSKCFLLTGDWGSGKTYEVEQFFDKYYKWSRRKVYRISCYGLDTRKAIVDEINTTIEQEDNSLYAVAIRFFQLVPVVGELANKLLKKDYTYKSVNNTSIFVFDDFERITARSNDYNDAKDLYRQSRTFLRRNNIPEFEEIKEEFHSVEKAFSKIEEYAYQKILRSDNDKYSAIAGLINELIETYGLKVIILCNSDVIGEKFVYDSLRSKLNCVEYKKAANDEVKTSIIDNIKEYKLSDDKGKSECIYKYIELAKDEIQKKCNFKNMRLFNTLLESFIDTAMLFDKELLTKDFLTSLFNSVLLAHWCYHNKNGDKLDIFMNGSNIEFLVHLSGMSFDTENFIRLSNNSDEIKWVDLSVSAYWIFNLSKPKDTEIIEKEWKANKYSELEYNLLYKENFTITAEDCNILHLLYNVREKDGANESYNKEAISRVLKGYDFSDVRNVEFILDTIKGVITSRLFVNFFADVFEIMINQGADTEVRSRTHIYNMYNKYLTTRDPKKMI